MDDYDDDDDDGIKKPQRLSCVRSAVESKTFSSVVGQFHAQVQHWKTSFLPIFYLALCVTKSQLLDDGRDDCELAGRMSKCRSTTDDYSQAICISCA